MSYLNQTVQVPPGQCTKEPTFVEELSGRLEKAIAQATSIRSRVRTIADLAYGPKDDEKESGPVSVPSGTLGAVRQKLDFLERLLGGTLSILPEIELIV